MKKTANNWFNKSNFLVICQSVIVFFVLFLNGIIIYGNPKESLTSSFPPPLEPAHQPTDFTVEEVSSAFIKFSFTKALLNPQGYIVLRRTSGTATAPVDGDTYTENDTYSGQTVVSVGPDNTIIDKPLKPGVKYHYAIYAFNGTGAGINYRQISPLKNSVETTKPPEIFGLSPAKGEAGSTSVEISGQNFAADALNNAVVYVGGKQAVVDGGENSDRIEITVPKGIRSISDIKVVNLENNLFGSSLLSPNPIFYSEFPDGEIVPEYTYPSYELAVGDEAIDVTVADMNDDGFSDIVVVNQYSDDLSVYYRNNDGDGFGSEENLSVGNDPDVVKVADINNDGLLDLVVSHYSTPGKIRIFTRSTDNSGFESPISMNTPPYPNDMLLEDLNADGLIDIAITCGDANGTTAIFYRKAQNDGFADPPKKFELGSGVSGLTAGDFDKDGKLDLAVCLEKATDDIQIMLRSSDNKTMNLLPMMTTSNELQPSKIKACDLNNDQILDLICLNAGQDKISILENKGSGAFDFHSSYDVGSFPTDFEIGDYDGDGYVDIATVNSSGDNISILLGVNHNFDFSTAESFDVGDTPAAIVSGDINDDGRPDFLVTNTADNTVSVMTYKEAPINIQSIIPNHNRIGAQPDSMIVIEFDGRIDASTVENGETFAIYGSISGFRKNIIVDVSDEFIKFYLPSDEKFEEGELVTVSITNEIQSTDGATMLDNFLWQFTIEAEEANAEFKALPSNALGFTPFDINIGDFDNDSLPDVGIVNEVEGKIHLWRNDAGEFQEETSNESTSPSKMVTADVNMDGRLDLLTLNNGQEIQVKLNLDGISFSDFSSVSLETAGNAKDFIVVDIDSDGKQDIVVLYKDYGEFALFYGKGDGYFEEPTSYTTAQSSPIVMSAADFDQDGYIDLAIGHETEDGIYIYFNDPYNEFVNNQSAVSGVSIRKLIAVPINNEDNTVDLVWVDDASEDINLSFQKTDGTFDASEHITAGSTPTEVLFADINGDNYLDVIVANYDASSISMRTNDGSGSFMTGAEVSLPGKPIGLVAGDFNNNAKIDFATVLKDSKELIIIENDFKPIINVSGGSPSADSGLLPGTDENIIYRLDLFIEEKDSWMSQLSVQTKGDYSTSDIKNYGFSLWHNNTDDLTNATNLTVSQSSTSGAGEWIDFGEFSQSLNKGDSSYFWVTVDISATASDGLQVGIEGISFEKLYINGVKFKGDNPTTDGELFTIVNPEPSEHVTSFSGTYMGVDSIRLNWDDATGTQVPDGYIVRARKLPDNFIPLEDGVEAIEDSDWSDGTILKKVNHLGSVNKVGFGGLSIGKYEFAIVPYTNSGTFTDYKLASMPKVSMEFFAEPTIQADSVDFISRKRNKIKLKWKNGDGAKRIVVASTSASITPPSDMNHYTADSVFGSGDETATGDFVVYNGTGNAKVVAGLSPKTQYYFQVFEMNGDNSSSNYLSSSTSTNPQSFITLAQKPSNPANSLVFSERSTSSIRLTYTIPASAEGVIVLRRGTNPPSPPKDGQAYTAGDLIGDQTVAYFGSDNSFVDSGLSPATTYEYDIFTYKGDDKTTNYYEGSPLNGKVTILASEPTTQTDSLVFYSRKADSIKLKWKKGNGSKRIVIASKSASISAPSDEQSYQADTLFANGDATSTGDYVVYKGTGDSTLVTGLSPATEYHFHVFEMNGDTVSSNYLSASSSQNPRSAVTLATQPVDAPSSLVFSERTVSSVRLTYNIPASADGVIVLRRGTNLPSPPKDGQAYTAGDLIGDQTVAYFGSDNSFVDSGLSPAATYEYDIFTYKGDDKTTNYYEGSPLNGKVTILASEPTTQTDSLVFYSRKADSIKLKWKKGNGSKRIVIASKSASISAPSDEQSYQADTVFANGDQTDTGDFVVYKGMGDSTLVTGLSPATQYHFHVFEMNGDTVSSNYLSASSSQNPRSAVTLATQPVDAPSSLVFSERTVSSVRLTYNIPASADGVIVLRRGTNLPSPPKDGQAYTAGDLIGDQTVAYFGSDNSFVDSGLSPATTYEYDIFTYRGSGNSTNYLESNPLNGTVLLPTVEPSVQASNLKATHISTDQITLTWDSGDGNGRILLIKEEGTVDAEPEDMVKYTANSEFKMGDNIEGQYVVFVGNGNEVTVEGLSPNTSYGFAIGEFNETGAAINYLTTLGAENSEEVATLQTEPTSQPTDLVFEDRNHVAIYAKFTTSEAEGYLKVRRTGDPYPPQDGHVYAIGESFNGQYVVGIDASLSVFDTLLSPETNYTYDIYAFNGWGSQINYLQVDPLSGSTITLTTPPKSPPRNLNFTKVTSSTIEGRFKRSLAPVDGYLILSTDVEEPNVEILNGTTYSVGEQIGDVVVIGVGNDTTFTRTGLENNTAYQVGVLAYTGSGNTIHYLTDSVLVEATTTFNSAPKNLALSDTSISEGLPIGTPIGTLTANDVDPTDIISFDLVSGAGSGDNSSFYIEENTLKVNEVFIHNLRQKYRIRVAAKDQLGASVEKVFIINLEKLPVNTQDSLSLVAVYDSAFTNIPWDITEPVSNWAGVKLQLGRVNSLSLKAYRIENLNTDAIGELDSLKTLDLRYNKLTFKYLEPIIDSFDSIAYLPQFTGLSIDTMVVMEGQEVTLSVVKETENETFWWKRQGLVIESEITENYTLGIVEKSDRGLYRAFSASSKVPELVVNRNPIYLNVISSINTGDSLVLKEVYEALGVSFDPHKPAGSWPGVVEENNKVIEINLSNRNLGGEIIPAIGQLTSLVKLDLFNNNLSGEFPIELTNLINLTYLDLDDNNLEGAVPDDIGELTKLKTLWLSRNKLTELPSTISSLTSLEYLFLQENKLDSLPDELGNLEKLKVLNASENKLKYFPSSISGLDSLETLNLADNELESISTSILSLSKLKNIDLSNNNLIELPGDFKELHNLEELKVHGNYLDFGDLEPLDYTGSYYSNSYIPQRWSYDVIDTIVLVGNNLDWQAELAGNNNLFQWFKNGETIDEATNKLLSLVNVSSSHLALYTCAVTNIEVPDLTLYAQPFRLLIDCGSQKQVNIDTQYDIELCEGENIYVELIAESIEGRTYRWKKDGRNIALADASSYIAFEPGRYSVVISDDDGCSATSNQIEVITQPTPEVAVSMSDSVTLEAEINGNIDNGIVKWYLNGQELEDANETSLKIDESGVYQAAFENQFGCEGISKEQIMVITALENESFSREMVVYPNPTVGKCFIELDQVYKNVSVSLIDMSGKKWSTDFERNQSILEVDLEIVPSGTYLLLISTEKGDAVKRIQKQ